MPELCEHLSLNKKSCLLDYRTCRYVIQGSTVEMCQCEQANLWKANKEALEQWKQGKTSKTLITEDDYKIEVKRLIATKVLTWNMENAQDLQRIITDILAVNDEGSLENLAIDWLARIRPPSFIDVKELNKLFPNDCTGIIETIYAIDKNLECYYLDDGEVFNLNDAINDFR
jgi:hypothetical protein